MGFFLQKLLSSLILPPGIIVPAAALAFLLYRRGRAFAAKAVAYWTAAFLLLLAYGPVSDGLLGSLEDAYPSLGRPEQLEPAEYQDYEAVIVLGGGFVTGSPEEDGASAVEGDFYPRLLYGARLASRVHKPLAIAGGTASGGSRPSPEGATRLLRDIGFTDLDIYSESESQTTKENASQIAANFPWRKVLLVTSAYHMPRSMIEFRKAGFDPLAAPAGYRVMRAGASFQRLLPQSSSFDESSIALKEYLGIVMTLLF